jgi:hypothetical protein
MHGRRSADRQGDQKLILHRQNAIHVDPGKILDEGKKKRAVRVKQMVSIFPLSCIATLTVRTSSRS